jgi:site-specific recombinase XerD
MKRSAPAEARFLERDEVEGLLRRLPTDGRHGLRDRTLVLFSTTPVHALQEVADLLVDHLDLGEHPRVRLHGKGDKWRTCPLLHETAKCLGALLEGNSGPDSHASVFTSNGHALTRSGIYKIVRRHASSLDDPRKGRRVCPHVFRHTAAVHLLESGVEINVIRGWLGHADLTTTNRYAEINTRAKLDALRATEPPASSAASRVTPVWRSDGALLDWLSSL